MVDHDGWRTSVFDDDYMAMGRNQHKSGVKRLIPGVNRQRFIVKGINWLVHQQLQPASRNNSQIRLLEQPVWIRYAGHSCRLAPPSPIRIPMRIMPS